MAHIFNRNTRSIEPRTRSAIGGITGDEIDLRKEFHDILHGTVGLKPKGHWVLVRHFYIDRPTEDYDPVNKEARSERAFETNDQLVLAYRARPWLTQYAEKQENPGLFQSDIYIYYFEHTVEIDVHDFIYEYDLDPGQEKPTSDMKPVERYNVKFIDKRRADNGRVEYIRVIAERDQSNRI